MVGPCSAGLWERTEVASNARDRWIRRARSGIAASRSGYAYRGPPMVPEAQSARPCSTRTKRGSGMLGRWAHGGGRGWVQTRSVRANFRKRDKPSNGVWCQFAGKPGNEETGSGLKRGESRGEKRGPISAPTISKAQSRVLVRVSRHSAAERPGREHGTHTIRPAKRFVFGSRVKKREP